MTKLYRRIAAETARVLRACTAHEHSDMARELRKLFPIIQGLYVDYLRVTHSQWAGTPEAYLMCYRIAERRLCREGYYYMQTIQCIWDSIGVAEGVLA